MDLFIYYTISQSSVGSTQTCFFNSIWLRKNWLADPLPDSAQLSQNPKSGCLRERETWVEKNRKELGGRREGRGGVPGMSWRTARSTSWSPSPALSRCGASPRTGCSGRRTPAPTPAWTWPASWLGKNSRPLKKIKSTMHSGKSKQKV